jgi:hypothetical protein
MWIIIDKKMPSLAKQNLSKFGNLIELQTNNITYSAISGHPDIFFCNFDSCLFAAPNLPREYFNFFEKNSISFRSGKKMVESNYPGSARYNAVVTDDFLIHNIHVTDVVIKENVGNRLWVNVNQGYARCNLLALPGKRFITSDRGIERKLLDQQAHVLYVNPEGIVLEGFANGFFGGCCGIFQDTVFICGSLQYYREGEKVKKMINSCGLQIIELYDGPLTDTGSIVFVPG